ncbi:SDR family oxidoreductase [Tengunoibacter tsumagoiensis]|uniref:NAD(P)-dependent oxidoreductase n=1 Tax=Tengunoibacter tsumagoiensis TaxID=2014871 RepID=A0A401ZWF9_9CHLR|nr:SDR family oxidoreductase [Tengunoibacter tsumagoiensis]GCE11225.1 NAD(P)-dependent oxidoreductase [Tengunoibacter tsumagoiensis]
MSSILLTGASGNVGREVAAYLQEHNVAFRVTTHRPADAGAHKVYFDFEKPETFLPAFTGITKLFLIRPPQIADAKKVFLPLLEAAKEAGIQHIVFLSLMGVEKNKVVPHAKIEEYIIASGIPYTMLRPSFFMQNLFTQHAKELYQEHCIYVPAGKGKTSFIDVRDIGAVGAISLMDDRHQNKAYTLTGSEALDYYQVARIFTEELGYPIAYAHPSTIQFFLHERKKGTPLPFILVMSGIYLTAMLGLAAGITPTVAELLGRPPLTVKDFAHHYRAQLMGTTGATL